MDTSTLNPLFRTSGPFATVLVDVGHDSENGAHEHELRVRAACEELRQQGADEPVLEALTGRLGELVDRPTPVGRVVVANPDGVVFDEVAQLQVDQPVATWGPLPDLARWIAHRDAAVTYVLAVVDHEGGDVGVYTSDLPGPEELTSVGGDTENIHQKGADDWGALKFQHRTENVWAKNAADVAAAVTERVRAGTRLVLLAGDPRSVSMVRDDLDDTHATIVTLEHGGRAEDGGDTALQHAVREALVDQVVRRRIERVHELRERVGRGEAVAVGADDVADALVRGQVETLLLDPAAAAEVEVEPSRHPGLVLGDNQPDGPVPGDQALVAGAVLTDAEVAISSSRVLGGEPVAALLRWDQ